PGYGQPRSSGDHRGECRFDDALDPGLLHRRVDVDPRGHPGVVERRVGLHREVLDPAHPHAAVDLAVLPPDPHVLERAGLHPVRGDRTGHRVRGTLRDPAPDPALLVRVHGEPEAHRAAVAPQDLGGRVLAEQAWPRLDVVGHRPDDVHRRGDDDRVVRVPAHTAATCWISPSTDAMSCRGVVPGWTVSSVTVTPYVRRMTAVASSSANES